MSYNMTFVDGANNIFMAFQGANEVSGGIPVIFLLILLFVALIAVFRDYDISVSMAISSFVISIVSGLLWFASMIGWHVVIIPVVILVGSLIVMFINKS